MLPARKTRRCRADPMSRRSRGVAIATLTIEPNAACRFRLSLWRLGRPHYVTERRLPDTLSIAAQASSTSVSRGHWQEKSDLRTWSRTCKELRRQHHLRSGDKHEQWLCRGATPMSELWRLSASEVARLVRTRKVSAHEVADAALQRLDSVNPRINAIVDCRPDLVREQADRVDGMLARGNDPGPLAGVAVTVKLNIDQAGFATSDGSRL